MLFCGFFWSTRISLESFNEFCRRQWLALYTLPRMAALASYLPKPLTRRHDVSHRKLLQQVASVSASLYRFIIPGAMARSHRTMRKHPPRCSTMFPLDNWPSSWSWASWIWIRIRKPLKKVAPFSPSPRTTKTNLEKLPSRRLDAPATTEGSEFKLLTKDVAHKKKV